MEEKNDRLEMIRKKLEKLVFAKPNDCVRLAFGEEVDIGKLDLSLLTELRRSDKGTVEVKLLDRTKLLDQLMKLAEGGGEQAEQFLQALLEGIEDGDAEA